MKKLVLMLMLLAPMTMMAQKFGKVNTQTIMQALPDVAKANGELEALQKQKDNELMQPIVAKVRAAIDAVGKAGNYTYIFEEGAAIYTGSNVLDVTKEVQSKIK